MRSREEVLRELRQCAASWEPDVKLIGNVSAAVIVALCDGELEAPRGEAVAEPVAWAVVASHGEVCSAIMPWEHSRLKNEVRHWDALKSSRHTLRPLVFGDEAPVAAGVVLDVDGLRVGEHMVREMLRKIAEYEAHDVPPVAAGVSDVRKIVDEMLSEHSRTPLAEPEVREYVAALALSRRSPEASVEAVVSDAEVETMAYAMFDPKNRLRPRGKVLPHEYLDLARAGLMAIRGGA